MKFEDSQHLEWAGLRMCFALGKYPGK